MSQDQSTASDIDSLVERVPLHNDQDEETENEQELREQGGQMRRTVSSTSVAAPRPNSLQRGKLSAGRHRRQGQPRRSQTRVPTGSPSNAEELASGHTTPAFTMTQSMYEPSEKRIMIEREDEETKLMKLMAKEKSATAAKEKKNKELKKKAQEQKKKNDERQRLADERRQKMSEEINRNNTAIHCSNSNTPTSRHYGNMSASNYGNMSLSRSGNLLTATGSSTNFLDSRPMCSTGKVFGFGSSTPRHACTPLSFRKKGDRWRHKSVIETNRIPMSSSMFTSQIFPYSSVRGSVKKQPEVKWSKEGEKTIKMKDLKNKDHHLTKQSKTALHRPQKDQDTTSSTNEPPSTWSRCKPPTSPATPESLTTPTMSTKDRMLSAQTRRSKSGSQKSPQVCDTDSSTALGSSDDTKEVEYQNRIKEHRRLAKEKQKKIEETKNKEEEEEVLKETKNESTNETEDICRADYSKVPDEINEEECEKGSKKTEEQVPEIGSEERKLTEDCDADSLNEETVLDKEVDESKDSGNATQCESEDKTQSTEETKVSESLIETTPRKVPQSEETEVNDVVIPENEAKETETKAKEPESSSLKVPETVVELTASSDDLARRERRRKLETIMSRIRTTSGSTDNLAGSRSNMTKSSSRLQELMDRGTLSGMSKATAILMRQSQEKSVGESSMADKDDKIAPLPTEPPDQKTNFNLLKWQDKYSLNSEAGSSFSEDS